MIVAMADVPLYVPLLFLALGLLLLFVNRRAFRDFDGELLRMGEQRAQSKVVRLLGGSGDATEEYEGLRRTRWLVPAIAVVYFVTVELMFVRALAG